MNSNHSINKPIEVLTQSAPVDYVELYNELNQLIKKYITMNDDDRNLLALDIRFFLAYPSQLHRPFDLMQI